MAIYTFTWDIATNGGGAKTHHQINYDLGAYHNIKAVRATLLGTRDTNPDQVMTYRLRYIKPDHYEDHIIHATRLPGVQYKETLTGSWDVKHFEVCVHDAWVSVHTDSYWLSFKIELSESGDFPPEERIPGQRFCMDGHLYEVSPNGIDYVLIEANAPICATPGVCPDFWVDPVGAVVCWILNAFESAIGLISGGFYVLQQNMASFINDFGAEIVAFLEDPVAKIQEWMSGVFVLTAGLLALITTEITTWWSGVVDTIGGWWSSTWADIATFWSDLTTHIGTWWDGVVISTGAWIADTWINITTFWDDITTNINDWYTANLEPTIDAISTGWSDFTDWLATVPEGIGQWWTDRMTDLDAWRLEFQTNFNNFTADFSGTIGDWWTDRVVDMGIWLADRKADFDYWVENDLPGIVEGMIKLPEWLAVPFGAIGLLAQAIIDMLAGTYPKETKIQEAQDTIKTHQTEINRILDEL